MEERTTVVIDIQLDNEKVANELAAVNREMASLRQENAQLKKDVKDGTKTWEEVSSQLAVNDERLRQLNASQRALSGQVNTATRKNLEYGTSLKEQASLLAELKRRYQSLDETQRNSAGGQKMLKEIQDLDAKIKDADASQGIFSRNVGNYKSAVEGLGGAFRGAGVNVGSFGKAINALKSGGPVIAGITAAVSGLGAAVDRLTKEFEDNEKAQKEMHVTMSAVEVDTYASKRAWNDFADWFNVQWRKTVDALVFANYKFLATMDAVVNFFGGDSKASENYAKQNILMRKVAEAENKLVDDTRRFGVEEAKIRNEIAALRAKSYDKEKYTAEERREFLNQIEEKELYLSKQRENLAKRDYAIQLARSKMAQNSKEENDKLYAAEKKVIDANTEFLNVQGNINRRRSAATREIEGETKATNGLKKAVKKVRDAVEEIDMASYDESLEESTKKNKALADSIQEVADRLGALQTEMQGLQDSSIGEGIAASVENISDTVEDAPSKLEQWAASFKNNAKDIESTAESLGSSFGSLSDIYKQMAEDESRSEEERAEAARKSKQWSAVQIAANSGVAMAKGIADAMDSPFPANIAALASTVAALLTAIAQAKALAQEGFSTGGVIGGFHGATMGPDNAVANVRRGEMVITAQQQRQLYELANGGAGSSITASLVQALQAMPAPVLQYSEFAAFQDRIVTLNETQKLQ